MSVHWRWAWPGNVAELRQVVEQVARASAGGVLVPTDLPAALRGATPVGENLVPAAAVLEEAAREAAASLLRQGGEGNVHRAVLNRVEKALLELALEQTNGVKLAAARLLGINRNTLYNKLPLIEEP